MKWTIEKLYDLFMSNDSHFPRPFDGTLLLDAAAARSKNIKLRYG